MNSAHPPDLQLSQDRLFDAVCAFGESLDLQRVVQTIVERCCAVAALAGAALLRWDESRAAWSVLAQADDRGDLASDLLGTAGDRMRSALDAGEPLPIVSDDGALPWAYVIPLHAEAQALGILALWPADEFGTEDHANIWRLVAPATAALHNALIFAETYSSLRDRVIEVSTIEVVSRHISATLDLQVITSDVLAAAMSAIDAARGQFALAVDDDHYVVVAQFDEQGTRAEPEQALRGDAGMVRQVMRTGQPLLLSRDSLADSSFDDWMADTRSALCVPIIREKPIGALSFQDPRPDAFGDTHLRFVATLAEHAAIAIENARLFEDRRRQIETLLALRRLSLRLLSTLDQSCVVDIVIEAARDMTQAREANLYLRDRRGALALVARQGAPNGDHGPTSVLPDRQALLRHVLRTGELYTSVDLPQSGFRVAPRGAFAAWVGVPVTWAGQPAGVLEVVVADPDHYTQYEIQALSLLANQAAVAIENARLYEEVRGARDQMQLILESTDEAMFLFDGQARLLRYNPRAEAMLGLPLHEYLGAPLRRWLNALGRARLQRAAGLTLAGLRDYIQGIRSQPSLATRRQFDQADHGDTHHIFETGSPVLDDDGALAGWLLVWRDNTEEYKLETLRLELSNMIVHDLRNPISSISNSLDMLREWLAEDDADEAAMTEVISIAQDSANSLLNLVQSLLDIARLEQHEVTLYRSELDLAATVDNVLASMMSLIGNAQIDVEIVIPHDLPRVWADGEKIQRVLLNLLDNALRYTPFGGRIVVRAGARPAEVEICIEDSGPGIPPEARDHVFDKYAQLSNKAFRGARGTGLGLAFCKLAVEAHGGRIWIEDGSAGGAGFHFTLPTTPDGRELTPS